MIKNYKNSSGITLLSLTITIIVLLIISAVSIWSLSGDHNLITQSMNAKDVTSERDAEAEVQEQWLLVQNDAKNSYLTNAELAQNLKDRLNRRDKNANVTYTNNNFSVSYMGYTFTLN